MIMRDIKELKRLAILKWEYLVKHPCDNYYLGDKIPELANEVNYCAFCTEYYHRLCKGCPIVVDGMPCYRNIHPVSIWASEETKETAQRVLNLIKAIPEE